MLVKKRKIKIARIRKVMAGAAICYSVQSYINKLGKFNRNNIRDSLNFGVVASAMRSRYVRRS